MISHINHPELGIVDILRRRGSTRFSASWRKGRVRIICPFNATADSIVRALDSFTTRLLKMKPSGIGLSLGTSDIILDGLAIHFARQSISPLAVILSGTTPEITLSIGSDIDISHPSGADTVRRACISAARNAAQHILLPRATQIAASLGCRPRSWAISRGATVLGRCNRAGDISLSAMCVFLPQQLRDYIICHELAHLSHMNHSPAFHSLLNSYLNGAEAQLTRSLKNYRWPIPR